MSARTGSVALRDCRVGTTACRFVYAGSHIVFVSPVSINIVVKDFDDETFASGFLHGVTVGFEYVVSGLSDFSGCKFIFRTFDSTESMTIRMYGHRSALDRYDDLGSFSIGRRVSTTFTVPTAVFVSYDNIKIVRES